MSSYFSGQNDYFASLVVYGEEKNKYQKAQAGSTQDC